MIRLATSAGAAPQGRELAGLRTADEALSAETSPDENLGPYRAKSARPLSVIHVCSRLTDPDARQRPQGREPGVSDARLEQVERGEVLETAKVIQARVVDVRLPEAQVFKLLHPLKVCEAGPIEVPRLPGRAAEG